MNEFQKLIDIMRKLRDPENGCPWDKVQTPDTLKEYILEEAYELIEAIEEDSPAHVAEELGDLLLQVVFVSQINSEKGFFSIKDVVNKLNKKLISRHPHIFGNVIVNSPEEVKNNWEAIKKKEKKRESIISDYPDIMPALSVSKRYGEQASSSGFDWGDPLLAIEKVLEEIVELKDEIKKDDIKGIEDELGDLLFSIANVARLTGINPEIALRKANNKFKNRFRKLENEISKRNSDINALSLDDLNSIWDLVKKSEKKN